LLSHLKDPYLLINETCISAGSRISEVLGLQVRHFNFQDATLSIEQRSWHQNIDKPKTQKSKRKLTNADFGQPVPNLDWQPTSARSRHLDLPTTRRPLQFDERRTSQGATIEGCCDFPRLGPHSFRRANITWRQEVGGSSIEASKIAGHASVRMTEEYTVVQLTRQEVLTRRIQDKLARPSGV
jgi:integrase